MSRVSLCGVDLKRRRLARRKQQQQQTINIKIFCVIMRLQLPRSPPPPPPPPKKKVHTLFFRFLWGRQEKLKRTVINHFHIGRNSTRKWCRKHAEFFKLVLIKSTKFGRGIEVNTPSKSG